MTEDLFDDSSDIDGEVLNMLETRNGKGDEPIVVESDSVDEADSLENICLDSFDDISEIENSTVSIVRPGDPYYGSDEELSPLEDFVTWEEVEKSPNMGHLKGFVDSFLGGEQTPRSKRKKQR